MAKEGGYRVVRMLKATARSIETVNALATEMPTPTPAQCSSTHSRHIFI